MSWAPFVWPCLAGASGLWALYLSHRLRAERRRIRQPPEATTRNRLALEILEAHRRQQRRMSSDLHDGVSQNLAGISLLLESLAGQMRNESSTVAEKLDRISELVKNTGTMAEDRVLGYRLDEERAATEGLRAALEGLAQNIEDFFSVKSTVIGNLSQDVVGTLAGHLYRIAEEAAYNAVRHGQPKQIRFQLQNDTAHAVLHIEDDGHGISETRDPEGRGLRLMALRSKNIGASLEVVPQNAGGTRVTCRWPASMKEVA